MRLFSRKPSPYTKFRFWISLPEFQRYAAELDDRLPKWDGLDTPFSQYNPWTAGGLDPLMALCIVTEVSPSLKSAFPKDHPARKDMDTSGLRYRCPSDQNEPGLDNAPRLFEAFPDLAPKALEDARLEF